MNLNFSNLYSERDLLKYLNQTQWANENTKNKTLRLLQSNDQDAKEMTLKYLGATQDQINRIYRYPSGRLKSDNQLRSTRGFNYEKDYSFLDHNSENGIYENLIGIVIPAFETRNGIILYEPNSDFMLAGSKALVYSTIMDAISTLSNYRIESSNLNKLKQLAKEAKINYLFDKESKTIIPIDDYRILVVDPFLLIVATTCFKLDQINQPYPRKFLLEKDKVDPLLTKLIKHPVSIFVLGQIFLTKWVNGDPESYTRFGLVDVCMDADYSAGSTFKWSHCDKKYKIIPISIEQPSKHQMVLIINQELQEGIFFDPSGYSHPSLVKDLEQQINNTYLMENEQYIVERSKPYKKEIMNRSLDWFQKIADHLKIDKHDPTLKYKILRIFQYNGLFPNDVDLNFHVKESKLCPLQERGDSYCIAWSYYLSVLYLLNDLPFDNIVEYLLSFSKEEIPVIIPRFLTALDKEIVETFLTIQV